MNEFEWMNIWINEYRNEWIRMNEYMNACMHASMHDWMNEWMNEWIKMSIQGWMIEWKKLWWANKRKNVGIEMNEMWLLTVICHTRLKLPIPRCTPPSKSSLCGDLESSSDWLITMLWHVLITKTKTWSYIQGIWKSAGKFGKKRDFVSEKCDFCQKVWKSEILAQKCKIMDFGQIVYNSNFAKIVWFGVIFAQKYGIAPLHFSSCPGYET